MHLPMDNKYIPRMVAATSLIGFSIASLINKCEYVVFNIVAITTLV
jgi:hypothetical protein